MGIGVGYFMMDSNDSINAISKFQKKQAVDVDENWDDSEYHYTMWMERKADLAKKAVSNSKDYKEATRLVKDINTNMEDTTKPKEKKGLLDYWWALVGVYFFFKMIFRSD